MHQELHPRKHQLQLPMHRPLLQNYPSSRKMSYYSDNYPIYSTSIFPNVFPQYKQIEHYVFNLSDIVGKGSFSIVYKAKNLINNETVAVKVIEIKRINNPVLQKVLDQQISILRKVHHPNIVSCLDIIKTVRNYYIVLEYCEGGNLESVISSSNLEHKDYLPSAQQYILGIYNGLLYLEHEQIVHRDIKASNIMLHQGVAKIADFGFAINYDDSFQDINIGSPAYMSPEGLIENIYGQKTDVWSFGILLFEICHGKNPFSHCENEQQLKELIKIPFSWDSMRGNLPSTLKRLIVKCLAIREEDRPAFSDLIEDEYIVKIFQRENTNELMEENQNHPTIHQTTPNKIEQTSTPESDEACKSRINGITEHQNNETKAETNKIHPIQKSRQENIYLTESQIFEQIADSFSAKSNTQDFKLTLEDIFKRLKCIESILDNISTQKALEEEFEICSKWINLGDYLIKTYREIEKQGHLVGQLEASTTHTVNEGQQLSVSSTQEFYIQIYAIELTRLEQQDEQLKKI